MALRDQMPPTMKRVMFTIGRKKKKRIPHDDEDDAFLPRGPRPYRDDRNLATALDRHITTTGGALHSGTV